MSVKPLSSDELRRVVVDMNERIRRRRAAAPQGREVPIQGPRWADKILDAGGEILAIHADTAEPYPLDVHRDLSVEEHAVVVVRRVLYAGGSRAECERLLDAFGLPENARARLRRFVREVAS